MRLSSRRVGTAPDMHFADPMTSSPNAVSLIPDNPSTVFPHNPLTLDDLGGFGRSGSMIMGNSSSFPYALQMSNPIGHTLLASSQHVGIAPDMHFTDTMIPNPDAVSWMPLSPYIPPTLDNLGGFGTSGSLAMGSNHSYSYALETLNPNGHTSLVPSRHFGTAPEMPFADPMISSPNAVSWTSDSPSTVLYYHDGSLCNPPTLDGLGGFERSGSPAMGSNYSSSYTSQTQNLNDHTSDALVSPQYTIANSDNPEPDMLTYDPSSYNGFHQWPNFFTAQLPSQSQPPASQTPSILVQKHTSYPFFVCYWLRGDTRCGYEGTVEQLRQHCQRSHLRECRDACIQCRWEGCEYHTRGDPSIHVMRRDCMWRHINEVHLNHRRTT
ncbi:uncharacterized protein EDB91DRAFT_214400 [Suillus paluster]|uniref:uncharacterized protein n=1 Tax=Suillus paluster TaxID=48578 RepID=UPI001B87BE78|nr:uncharacterized protein EDB91DRAFT_214400 [Suillus paluster]KAG1722331.1 hypothetical protein EDB91DRAFT_214400 [Suillus paluster]